MRKFLMSVGAVVAVVGSASAASAAPAADPIGAKGSFFISAERLFGLQIHSTTEETTAGAFTTKRTRSYTDFGLLAGNPGLNGGGPGPYNIPQVGLDYAIIDSLTLGGAIGFWVSGARKDKTETTGAPTQETDGASFSAFKIAPRVGYIIGASEMVGIWLRGGFSYFSAGTNNDRLTGGGTTRTTTISTRGFALNLEPGAILMIHPNFGFGAFINVDIPLTGKVKTEETTGPSTTSEEHDFKHMNFGLTFAIQGKL